MPEVTDTIGAITSDIVVNDPAGGQITDVNVVIDVSHAWLTDLDIYLESPAGTVVELFTDVCTVEVDLDVTLDDEAATSIDAVACTPQITGTFQPVGSLSDFDGELASGTWQLQVTDDASANAGLLWDWSLEITTTNGVLPTAGCTDCFLLIPGTSGAAAPHGVTVSRITAAAPAGLQIADLNLTVDISHTFLGDLHIHLLSPSGTHVKVFEQACGVAVDMQAVFDDEAATGFDCDNRLGFNSYQPDPGLLSAFDNESASGTWTLVVIDDSNVDAGTLNDWALGFLLN
ncbi:MAG: proprotein convertase P-domain-containing protein [Thermomicrobiales bacterium]